MDLYKHSRRTLLTEKLHSAALNEERAVTLYLPPGYQEIISYPVLYTQDGADFIQFGRAATLANYLILEEGIEPFVIAAVHVDKQHRTSEYSPDGERFAAYMRFYAEELVPFVENKVNARAGSANRILAGDSLGGTVSLHLALSYPELFTRVIALSGAFFKGTRELLEQQAELSWLRLFMTVGTDETEVGTVWGAIDFLRENRLTKELLERKKNRLSYAERPGKHVWGYWQKDLPEAIRHFWG